MAERHAMTRAATPPATMRMLCAQACCACACLCTCACPACASAVSCQPYQSCACVGAGGVDVWVCAGGRRGGGGGRRGDNHWGGPLSPPPPTHTQIKPIEGMRERGRHSCFARGQDGWTATQPQVGTVGAHFTLRPPPASSAMCPTVVVAFVSESTTAAGRRRRRSLACVQPTPTAAAGPAHTYAAPCGGRGWSGGGGRQLGAPAQAACDADDGLQMVPAG